MTITLDRPDQLNAFTARMMHEMIAAFDQADADDDVRAVIVTGRGPGFCAGADLARAGRASTTRRPAATAAAAMRRGDPSSRRRVRDGGGMLTLRIFRCTKPVIAAINGRRSASASR